MAKEKSYDKLNEKESKTKSKRKSKSERTIEAQIELETEEMLKHIESPEHTSYNNGINITYKRPLRKF